MNENTYDISSKQRVTSKKFLEVSRFRRAKQRQRSVQKSGRWGGGAHAPSIILPQLPLKNPYENLKRRSLEKKLTCFVYGFVLAF